ncbi:IS110 family transposase [Aquibium pacificus]|uniref:IS110 family transposase n=1 Tax=Aquibium pacificus TaxID=3153579 RepID=UPI00349F74E7
MKYFAGLDVSLEETTICIVDEGGRIVREARAASEPEALSDALRKVDLQLERIGLEACSLTAWLHDALHAEGLPAICIETRQANAAMKTMPNKTDRNDARALAQIMRTGWYRQVHVKSRQCRLWRSLLVARRTVLNEMRSIENVVRAIPREAGIKLGTPSRTAFAGRVRELADGDAETMAMVEPLLTILGAMLKEFGRLTKQVLDIVGKEEVCRRLMSAPGVGPITALAFRATIDRPERFGSSRAVGPHLGLTPALPVRRNRHSGQDQPLRRRTRPHRALRGGSFAARALEEMVDPEGVGHEHRQKARHGASAYSGGPQTGRHPAPHVGRRNRIPLWKGASRTGDVNRN